MGDKVVPTTDMHLLYVALKDFRNYRRLEVSLSPGVTILWGPNASGKTSFLEALVLLATARSPRAGAERELIHWESPTEMDLPPFARIVGRVERKDDPLTLEVAVQRLLDPQGRLTGRCQKRFLLNRRPVRTREAVGRLQVVLFEPEDLNLITGSPARRRNYLDAVLLQTDPRYWQALERYRRVVLQRNRLLQGWKEKGGRPGGPSLPPEAREQVAFWNREMVQNGAYLIVARHRLVTTLGPLLETLHGRLAGAPEPLRLTYRHHVPCCPEEDEESVAYAFRQAMARAWPEEVERGMTLLGPHRDDLGFSLGKIDLAVYGSRGQQRTATIALKLAQVEWLKERAGETPVVLLDDVLSELDPERRNYLQGWLLEWPGQVLVTAADRQVFHPMVLEQATVVHIVSGTWETLHL